MGFPGPPAVPSQQPSAALASAAAPGFPEPEDDPDSRARQPFATLAFGDGLTATVTLESRDTVLEEVLDLIPG